MNQHVEALTFGKWPLFSLMVLIYGQDLARIKYNQMVIEDLKKRVKVLEKQEPNQANINLLQALKLIILQLETEINDLKDKLDRI